MLYPHERSLVKRMADKPFALLGINSDSDRKELGKVMKEQGISWRSWWDGGSTTGPIATKWVVAGWPTMYVLDADGVILYKGVRDIDIRDIEQVVEGLLKELAAKPGD